MRFFLEGLQFFKPQKRTAKNIAFFEVSPEKTRLLLIIGMMYENYN